MITSMILYIAGYSSVAVFTPARISLVPMLPLTIITCANIILMNLALAHSSILFYQIIRILLTPCMIHLSSFSIINAAGPVTSTVVAQIKTCLIVGLGWISSPNKVGTESVVGILFALLGIISYSYATRREWPH